MHPNWFYLSGESGAYHLFLITTPLAIPELDDLYNQYLQYSVGSDAESSRSAMREILESIITGNNEDIEVWELTFFLQD